MPKRNCISVSLWITFFFSFFFLLVTFFITESGNFGHQRIYTTTTPFPPTTFASFGESVLREYSPENISELCPLTPPSLVGRITVNKKVLDFKTLDKKYIPFSPGGHFKPANCTSRNKTAVIVAYRDRERHLKVLLNNLIPFLIKQQSEFVIFVVEPVGSLKFNRALLMNVGFVESLKMMNFTCFFFHDVDLIPVHDHNLYRCSDQPRHMSVANSKFKYRLPYSFYAGGVIGMSRRTYASINGQSNLFFGWGGEDDDLVHRLNMKKYNVTRHSVTIGRYEALNHTRDKGNPLNPHRSFLLRKRKNKPLKEDGLTTLKYSLVKKELRPIYTWILVDLDEEYYKKLINKIVKGKVKNLRIDSDTKNEKADKPERDKKSEKEHSKNVTKNIGVTKVKMWK